MEQQRSYNRLAGETLCPCTREDDVRYVHLTFVVSLCRKIIYVQGILRKEARKFVEHQTRPNLPADEGVDTETRPEPAQYRDSQACLPLIRAWSVFEPAMESDTLTTTSSSRRPRMSRIRTGRNVPIPIPVQCRVQAQLVL